jgi:hypothetical protein
MRIRVLGWVAVVLAGAFAGCGGDSGADGEGTGAKDPFLRYSESTQFSLVRTLPDGTKESYSSRPTSEIEIDGATYTRLQVGDDISSGSGSGVEFAGTIIDEDTVEVVRGAFSTSSAALFGVPAYVSATADEPILIDIAPPVGEPQSFSVSGTSVFGTPDAEPQPGTVAGTYTLAETDVTVDTPVGAVAGCNHYTVDATVPLLFGVDTDVVGDVWYSPRLGLVKAELASPLDGLGVGFGGSNDARLLDDGWATVQRVAVLGLGAADASFAVSSYDVEQLYNADKDTHAKMLLEVRFADETLAKSDQQPAVIETFSTDFGYYPSMLVASPVSFLFPEDNDQGFTHWIAFVDQAAKNQTVNGISYNIDVTYDAGAPPVRVAGRVLYKRVP